MDTLESLARATGLPLERVRRLAAEGRLHTLYNEYGVPVRQHETRRSMTHAQRQVALAEMRWPRPRLSGRQALLELYRLRGEWSLTRRQAEVERLRVP